MKKFICVILALIFSLPCVAVFAQPDYRGQSVIVALTDGEQIIYSKNPNDRISPSGLTKIFTALTAYDLKSLDETIIVAENIADYTSNLEITARLKPGEMLSFYDLLGAMVVGSANDAAYQTAITCCGDIEAFVGKMNEKAKAMGLENTNFTNPTGIYDENQYTSAADMLTIYRAFYKNEMLKELVSSQRWIIEPTNVSKKRVYWTNNHLLSTYYELKYFYRYAVSGKISSSSEGGYSIVATAARGGMNVIVIVLNSQLDQGVNYSLVDATNAFDYVFENYSPVTAVKENELICEIKVKNSADAGYTLANAKTQLKCVIKKTDSADLIEKKVNVPDFIEAPLSKGDVVGSAEYSYNGYPVGDVELVVSEDIGFSAIKYVGNGIAWFFGLAAVKAIIAVIVILFVAAVVLLVYLVRKAEQKKKSRKTKQRQKRGNGF